MKEDDRQIKKKNMELKVALLVNNYSKTSIFFMIKEGKDKKAGQRSDRKKRRKNSEEQ